MDEKKINNLADKWMKGVIEAKELQELELWYATYDNLEQEVSSDLNKEALEGRLFDLIAKRAALQHYGKGKTVLWTRIAAAAIILITLSAGSYFYFRNNKSAGDVQYSNVISPGGNKAVLTLANGQQIQLTDAVNGNLAQQGEIVITKTADGQVQYQAGSKTGREIESNTYNTMTTPRGGQYHLVLADGTGVWLNAESSITYPPAFKSNYREVSITGEVYFEVAKDKSKPFHVLSNGQEIEVLGTHFNVNAYGDESLVKTTLLEGSVKVSNLVSHSSNLLKPGQQAQVNGATLQISNADTQEVTAWKNGLFSFNKSDIQTVMRQFSRWYDVDVVYEGAIPQAIITGKVHRDTDLSTALEILTYLDIHFNINGRTITIKP